jgi:hypothetical protein
MNKFRQWYLRNQDEITWFLIGFLAATGVERFSTGNWLGAVLFFGLAYLNYFLYKKQ